MTAPRKLRPALAATALAATLLAGCAQPQQPAATREQVDAYVADYPPALRRLYAQVPLQGTRNAALNHMRAGLAALEAGALDAAARSFDEALKTIETIYADNPDAERARSVWYREAAKDFKGEAYERAMAYYYRGVIYLMQGDYQNARASFTGGLLQDTFMEGDERMASDFGALAFLQGWAGRCAGLDRATIAASFDEARQRNRALAEPPAANRLLVLFETGSAPLKVPSGEHNEVLRYKPPEQGPLQGVRLAFAGQTVQAVEAEDIFFQASTRAGRQVDAVNQGKVEYQTNTRTAGQVATGVGAAVAVAGAASGNRTATAVGAGVALAGIIAQAAAANMRTEADARQWDNLPASITLGSFAWRQPGRRGEEAQVSFARGKPEQRRLAVHAAGACAVAWGRELPAGRVPDIAPYSAAALR